MDIASVERLSEFDFEQRERVHEAGNLFSDTELRKRVRAYLIGRHFPSFESLELDVHDGEVTISGHVSSYYEKQVAYASCQRVAGVISLIDQIEVD